MLCRVVLCCVVLCCVVSCRVVLCCVVLCRVVSCRVVSCRVLSHGMPCAMWCHLISCHVQCGVMLCCLVSFSRCAGWCISCLTHAWWDGVCLTSCGVVCRPVQIYDMWRGKYETIQPPTDHSLHHNPSPLLNRHRGERNGLTQPRS